MGSLRFSLASLVGVVAALAFGLAALRSANQLWASAVFSLTLVLLLAAVLGVSFGHGPGRVYWGGFAIFGWAYLALALGPGFTNVVGPHLLTTKLLTAAERLLPQCQFGVGDKVLVQRGGGWYRSTILQVINGQYLIHYEGYSSASDELVGSSRIK